MTQITYFIKIATLSLAGSLIVPLLAFAQLAPSSPEIMLTWQAENFAPAEFRGKILPAKGSRITAALSLLEQDKISDISRSEIRWFVDDMLISKGIGMQIFEYRIPESADDEIRITAQLPNIKGQSVEKTITIPVVLPEIVLQSKYFNNQIRPGNIYLKAIPYFFNIQRAGQVSLEWLVNGNAPTLRGRSNPNEIVIAIPEETPRGTLINIRVTAKNIVRETEIALSSIIFTTLQ